MKNPVSILLGLFLIVCLVDGVLDIGIGVASRIRDRIADAARNDDPYADMRARKLAVMMDLPKRHVAGIGDVLQPVSVPGFTIGAGGERLHTHAVAPDEATRHILLLGASQAFGLFNDDDETLAAALERHMPGAVVRNFAMPGQSLPGNMMILKQRVAAGDRIDDVLVVNGLMDLIAYCLPPTLPPPVARPVLGDMIKWVTGPAPATSGRSDVCQTPDERAIVLDRLEEDIRGLLDVAHRHDLQVTLVLTPLPYVAGAGDGTFARLAQFQRYQAIMDPLMAALRERLDASGSDRVIDLSQSFDGTRQHGLFGDLYGHYTDAGNEALAPLIAEVLRARGMVDQAPE
ncbi:SGNH/GDSL hydrolase family protein [Tistrella bauzanensis]|uniref:SGNH/GDSL hydrolase family protein n=1 Tax=Tistrella arctica TaxID=3133430 RepID=A0ABU9YN88_9PROT